MRARWVILAGVLVLVGGGVYYMATSKRKGSAPKSGGGSSGSGQAGGHIVNDDPATLARAAGVSLDEEALARVMATEHPKSNETAKAGIGWVVVNQAKRRGVSISGLVLGSLGKFGSQNLGGRFVASQNPPSALDRRLAKEILRGQRLDPTGGAVQFDSPAAQRILLARGTTGYKKTPEDVAKSRRAEGKEMVTLPGIPGDLLRFWRPRAGAKGLVS